MRQALALGALTPDYMHWIIIGASPSFPPLAEAGLDACSCYLAHETHVAIDGSNRNRASGIASPHAMQ